MNNKLILSLTSLAAVLLFVGAGCSEASTLDTNTEIRENNTPSEQQIEKTETKEESGSDIKLNTEVNTNLPTVKNDDSIKEEENDENETEDSDDDSPVSVTPSPTPAPTPKPVTPAPSTPPATTVKTITMAEVQAANNQDKCWSVISGNVYDLTPFTPNHPGGERAILSLCGKDGTTAFQRQHGGQSRPETTLAKYYLGALKN